MIKGAMNRSSVGTPVEHTPRMTALAKMPDGTAPSALDGFSEALGAIPRESKSCILIIAPVNPPARLFHLTASSICSANLAPMIADMVLSPCATSSPSVILPNVSSMWVEMVNQTDRMLQESL